MMSNTNVTGDPPARQCIGGEWGRWVWCDAGGWVFVPDVEFVSRPDTDITPDYLRSLDEMEEVWDLNTAAGILEDMKKTLVLKAGDYAVPQDNLSNFRFSGYILDRAMEQGVGGMDLSFLALISTKLARLVVLLGSGKKPNNEAVADSAMDLANYAVLWTQAIKERNDEEC